jgi:hypothetical protein
VKKLRLFVLKGVANELQDPAEDKQAGGKHPELMEDEGRNAERQRDHYQRNANAVAQPVDWMSVAACVLRNPLFAAASAKHGRIIPQHSYCGVSRNTRVGPAWTWLSAVTS